MRRLAIVLVLVPFVAAASPPGLSPSFGSGSLNGGGTVGPVFPTKIACKITSATIVDHNTALPSTTCFVKITSSPPTVTLDAAIQIVAGTTDAQMLTIENRTNSIITINVGPGNVQNPAGGPITFDAQGGSQSFHWDTTFSFWILDNNTIDATQIATGVVAVPNGGTGLATLTAHALYVGNGTGTPTQIAVGATGQVLQGNTSADPSWGAPAVSSGSLAAIWSPSATAALADAANFAYPLKLTSFVGKVRRLTCSWLTIGTISGGTDVINMKVRDTTATSDLCNCTFTGAACNVVAGTIETCDCNSGAMTAGDVYTLQFSASTNCVANPAAVTCSVELVDP